MFGMMYVGYGSNLDPRDWSDYCARPEHDVDPDDLRPVTPVLLLDHRLTFNHRAGRWKGGAANVTPSSGDVVPCMAFEVDHPRIWDVLDAKEGVGADVYERFALALLPDGTVQTVITYRVTEGKLAREAEAGAALTCPQARRTSRRSRLALPTMAALGPPRAGLEGRPLQHVFVYGTLLAGEGQGHVLEACERRQATVTAQLVDLDRGYPASCPARPSFMASLCGCLMRCLLAWTASRASVRTRLPTTCTSSCRCSVGTNPCGPGPTTGTAWTSARPSRLAIGVSADAASRHCAVVLVEGAGTQAVAVMSKPVGLPFVARRRGRRSLRSH